MTRLFVNSNHINRKILDALGVSDFDSVKAVRIDLVADQAAKIYIERYATLEELETGIDMILEQYSFVQTFKNTVT